VASLANDSDDETRAGEAVARAIEARRNAGARSHQPRCARPLAKMLAREASPDAAHAASVVEVCRSASNCGDLSGLDADDDSHEPAADYRLEQEQLCGRSIARARCGDSRRIRPANVATFPPRALARLTEQADTFEALKGCDELGEQILFDRYRADTDCGTLRRQAVQSETRRRRLRVLVAT